MLIFFRHSVKYVLKDGSRTATMNVNESREQVRLYDNTPKN